MTKKEFITTLTKRELEELKLPDGAMHAARIQKGKKGKWFVVYPWFLIEYFSIKARRKQ